LSGQKRVLAIHDISCLGRCSLTVALPVISAAGIETTVLPTAVLSTHTGGFTGYTFRDLTDDMRPIIGHWRSLGLSFDAIYTGYLGSFRQLDIVGEIIGEFRSRSGIVIVDPVMGDNGSLYSGFTADFPAGMAELCSQADVIVPNMTEAALMLGLSYEEGPYKVSYVEEILGRLSQLGPRQVVLKGVYFSQGEFGAACYDAGKKAVSYFMDRKIDGIFYGTGDVFSSALTAAAVSGLSLERAVDIALRFTVGSIGRTARAGTDRRLGVNFEEGLRGLIEDIRASGLDG